MKKILSTLMVLALVMPALAADVDFVATDNGDGSFTISYSGLSPRGIALAVSTDGTTVGDATLGENGDVLSSDAAYNCFMDYASINPATYVLGAGHPLADPTAAGEPAYPASVFSVCLGALDEGGNQNPGPASSADLVTIQLSGTFPSVVDIDEDTFRGAVVGDAALITNLPIQVTVTLGGCTGDALFVTEWDSVGNPDAWCAENNPRQCHGDADGLSETKQSYWTYTGDLNVLLAAWGKPYATIAGQDYAGIPLINADFDHLSETKQALRVYTGDLNILLANWGQAGAPAADCANTTGIQ
jgi:hypothetical protein